MQPDEQLTNQRITHHQTDADISPQSASFACAEEVDDGADGREGVALGRGESDIERGFELAAKLDQVEGIPAEVVDERRIQPQSGRRKVEVPRDDGLDPTLN